MRPRARLRRSIRAGVLATALATAATATLGVVAAPGPAAAVAAVPAGRVDLAPPTFSDPTNITNPLFPIDDVQQAIQLGSEGDVALRHEITLLEKTKTIEWDGQQIEAVMSQFVAYGDHEILEVATDYFAQADDGSVWYLGEEVDNYEDGVIADHEGTWLAGRDGPAGMIMPTDPQVGDVYRPENIPDFVFEEVTVKQTDLTVDGPGGPVDGAILVQERLLDGTLEDKVFAPGYGEFSASVPSSDEYVEVAVAVPTDERDSDAPRELLRMAIGARAVFSGAPARSWRRMTALTEALQARWEALQQEQLPAGLVTEMNGALEALQAGVDARKTTDVRQASIDIGHATVDISMLFADLRRVEHDRLRLWRQQLTLDRAAGKDAGVAGDRTIIRTIARRIGG